MDIGLLIQASPTLCPDLLAEVQNRVHYRRCDACEAQTIAQSERGGQKNGAVSLIRRLIEQSV